MATQTYDSGQDMGHVLGRLNDQIQAQIAEVEQRHAATMQELQGKLERMTGAAERARPAMPVELATAFQRIESGMADLVDRIAETAPGKRRGADAFVFSTAKPDSSHFVFNPPKRVPVAPVSLSSSADGSHGEPWDPASAAALTQLYDSGEAVFGTHLPEAALFAPGQWAKAEAATSALDRDMAVAAPIMPALAQPVPATMPAAGLGDDRAWLDGRLTGIADHVSQTIAAAKPDGAFKTLMARVDQLETRFTSALDGIASRSDVAAMRNDALGQVEVQIKELASHIESTHRQLTRLDSIEQHLSDLTAFAHASMDAEQTAPNASEPVSHSSYDFAQLADLAVERALARARAGGSGIIDPAPSIETQTRVDAVHALLQDFAAERRRGDQYTTGMLETVQEALIRLIDRVDAIDAGTARGAETVHPVAAAAPEVSAVAPVVAPMAATGSVSRAPVGETTTATIDADARPRRTQRTVARPASELDVEQSATAAMIATQPVEGEPSAQPEISIKDLRLNARTSKIMASGGKADVAPPAEEPAAAAPKASRVQTVTAPAAVGNAGAGKRGLYVAVAALSLVGIGFMAQHLLSGGDGVSAPTAGLPTAIKGNAVPEIKKTGAVIAPAGQPSATNAGTLPPGLVMPAPQATNPARVDNPLAQRSELTRPPASIPETVSDDLSLVDQDNSAVGALAGVAAQPKPRAPSGSAITSSQPMQGLALALPTGRNVFGDLASANRQANQAAASERVGALARPARDFSQRFDQPAPVDAAKTTAAAIVTGSNPPARDGAVNGALADGYGDAIAEAGDLPPALVGPLSLRMAAAKGDPSAAFEVAARLAEGRGIKQDFKQAMVWYQRSAAKGLAIAQYRLGTLYERGLGTPVDPARAKVWYKRAADQGNVKAMHNMAVLSAGNSQVPPDYASASKWFKDAAERGLADSQFNLGVLYENGLGVAKDPRQAYVWFSLAARNGDAEALRRRDLVLATLDDAALKSANDDVQKWRSRPTDARVNDPRMAGDQWRSQSAMTAQPSEPMRAAEAFTADAAPTPPRGIRPITVPR